jgi:transcriptional regulator with XRE-family HTH domain
MNKLQDADIRKEVAALNIGRQIRQLRFQRGMTLKEVSEITGLSKPSLSQIENNDGAPPIATLIKIATALGVKIGHFFKEPESSQRLVVVRRDERHKLNRLSHEDQYAAIGYWYESLAYPMVEKNMEPFIAEIAPRDEGDILFNQHRGEEFIFVMDGRLEFRSPDQTLLLHRGDSLYFDAAISHGLRGIGGIARVLVVVYVPQ